jgi:putative DNA primase/helicase
MAQAREARRAAWPALVRQAIDLAAKGDHGALVIPGVIASFIALERDALDQWVQVKDEIKRIRAPLTDIIKAMRRGDVAPARGEGGRATGKKKPKSINFGDVNRLTEHFALLYGTDTVWDGESRKIMKINALRLAYSNDVVKMWLTSRERRTVPIDNVVFEPGVDLDDEHINLFDGLPIEPEAGDCGVMLELLYHLCSESAATDEGVEAVVQWVLRWLAYPLQHPGAKMQTALVFHGPQGTGKNLFFDAIRDLYGEYGVMVSQNELEDKFTSWMSRKLFIVGDEVVTRAEMYHKKNQLKWLVTADKKIPIRAIQQDVRWESNHVNLVFLSNESQPLALEDGDRRYLVVYTPTGRTDDLYARAAKFLEEGGAAKLLHYLRTLDLGDFKTSTKPVMTEAKRDLIELGLRPSERFSGEWLAGLLPLPVRPCSAEQLYTAFRRWSDRMGERFTPSQAVFTASVKRYVGEKIELDAEGKRRPPRLNYKVVNLEHEQGGRKSVRCWLPHGTGPRDPAVSEGRWVGECVREFQSTIDAFCRVREAVEGGE